MRICWGLLGELVSLDPAAETVTSVAVVLDPNL